MATKESEANLAVRVLVFLMDDLELMMDDQVSSAVAEIVNQPVHRSNPEQIAGALARQVYRAMRVGVQISVSSEPAANSFLRQSRIEALIIATGSKPAGSVKLEIIADKWERDAIGEAELSELLADSGFSAAPVRALETRPPVRRHRAR